MKALTLRERLGRMLLKMSLSTGVFGEEGEARIMEFFGGAINAGRMMRLGTQEVLKAYSTSPWLRAVVGRVSYSVSTTPWRLFVVTGGTGKGGNGGKAIRRRSIARCSDFTQRRKAMNDIQRAGNLREITDHPVLDLMDHGNPAMPGQTVFSLTQQQLDMAGESFWLMEKNGLTLPVDILNVPPHWVQSRPTPWEPFYQVTSYSSTDRIPEEDMIWFKHPDPADPYNRGSGVGITLGDEIETDEHATKHLKMWFRNQARPDVLVTGDGLKPSEITRLEQTWLDKLGGQKGTNRPFFMNRKVDVNVLSTSMADMQMSQLRRDERDIILHTYGVPPEIFGIIEHSNRSTIDASEHLYHKQVIVPRLEFLRIFLQIKLVELFDERLILDYVSPVQEDREFELKVMLQKPSMFMIDEWREMANRPELANGEGKGFMVAINETYETSLAGPEETTEEEDDPAAIGPANDPANPEDDDPEPPLLPSGPE